jgi:hypothetical protein
LGIRNAEAIRIGPYLCRSGLDKACAVGLKSLVDHQQSAHYCHQLPSRICGQHAQKPLPRTV